MTRQIRQVMWLSAGLVMVWPCCAASAQMEASAPQAVMVQEGEALERAKMEAMRREAAARGGPQPGQPPGGPGADPSAKPPEGPGKPEDKKEEKPATEGPQPITRPPAANTPADPQELKIAPDADGKINLQLRGQKWVDVLQMLADWSGLALDWTEIPGDAVNLTTTKKFTLAEARDTFNRMLLDRGYTMLVQPSLGTLSVHKLATLNPALVPRVAPEQLEQRDPYELVKVSFELGDWLNAEEVAKDLESMKSVHGKLNPLSATNRLEAIDTVANLRQIRQVLQDELSASGQKQRIRVFQLKHRNATDVEVLLRGLLGLKAEGGGRPAGMDPNMMEQMQQRMQQQMQQMMQQQQQQQQQQGKGGPPRLASEPEIRLVVNRRENMIIAHAPPEQMAIIEQAVEAVDIPTDQDHSLAGTMLRWQSYKLATMDPQPLVQILQEIGGLDFNTQIKIDEKANAIVAYASLADHVTIRTLIEKLDGSGRKFYVIKLRRLRADYVAGTIESMMGGKEDEDDRRSPFFFFGYSRRDEQQKQGNKFTVDADVDNNWLLLRANETEMEEIEDLLVQLGEIRTPGQNRSTVRYMEMPPGPQGEALLERIRRLWPSVAPNELNIDVPAPEETEQEKQKKNDAEGAREIRQQVAPPKTSTTQSPQPAGQAIRLAQLDAATAEPPPQQPATAEPPLPDDEQQLLDRFRRSQGRPAEDSAGPSPADTPPPAIKITRGPDGRLIISSPDTRALDLLEDLIVQQTPAPGKEYKIYKLRYADSLDVKYILEDFFEEEDQNNRGFFFYDYYSRSNGNDRKKLSDRAP